MKKVAIALTSAVIILVGCEDNKTNTTSAEVKAASSAVSTTETSAVAGTKADQLAKDTLDWQGVYKGNLPCDDCENIEVTLTLMPDDYTLVQIYSDADNTETTSQGAITWDDTGSIITLVNAPEPNQYVVGENMLTKLKFDGEKVDGEMATFTILTKQE